MQTKIRQLIKDWMLPFAMAGGIVFYKWIGYLVFLSPYLIFCMLTVTYCRLEIKDLKIKKFQICLLIAQMLLAFSVFGILLPFSHQVATGTFLCIFVPTATAAPVITGMLGGSITGVAAYSMLCNIAVAVGGPLILAAIGDHPELTFGESFKMICSSVAPLLLFPIVTALVLKYGWKKGHDFIANNQSFSFYMWAIALFIVVGSSVSFIIRTFDIDKMTVISGLVIGSMGACALQFYIGRKIGKHFGDMVTGGQSLGQKNTVLAIWLALTYLDPIASIGPAAYVAWHNIVNSYQLIRHNHHHHHKHS